MQTVTMPVAPELPFKAVERAERGAKMLDKLEPGWRDEIDLEMLDVATECCCVLGQLWGDYSGAWYDPELFLYAAGYDDTASLQNFAVQHGFNSDSDDSDDGDWDALNDAWRWVIAGR